MSVDAVGDWPQNVWAVSDAGWPLEAQLENQGRRGPIMDIPYVRQTRYARRF